VKQQPTKIKIFLVIIILSSTMACSQNFGPGYQFELFKNTPNWELALAVKNEVTIGIRRLLKEGNFNINLQEPKFGVTLLHLAIGNDKLASNKVY
jgi:hypothetical protein